MARPSLPPTFITIAIIALGWAIVARALGPSDLWHQTQPKTVAYTTDIIVNGGSHWILPLERGELPATKPPLYNWIAAPFVGALGFDSEFAHKMPSVIALVGCTLLLMGIGRAMDAERGAAIGALAATCFVANYSIFKLGYLARPDMLLTVWLLGAWACATSLLLRKERSLRLALGLWACVALAWLTKGPPALLPVIYAIAAARVVGGSWRSLGRLGFAWGLPLSLVPMGLWLWGVWRLDPAHLREELWLNEVYGRVTGAVTPDDQTPTLGDWLAGLGTMPGYFAVRFAPWSLLALAGVVHLFRRDARGGARRLPTLAPAMRGWVTGSMLFVVIVVVVLSLSAGKRADYIAAAFGPGAVLASWWMLSSRPNLRARSRWLGPVLGLITLTGLTIANQRRTGWPEPMPGFAANIDGFVADASAAIDQRPAEVAFMWTLVTYTKTCMGYSEPDSIERIDELIEAGEPFWVVGGTRYHDGMEFSAFYGERNDEATWETVVRSEAIPEDQDLRAELHHHGWPIRMHLYWVAPGSSVSPGEPDRDLAPDDPEVAHE